MNYELTKHAARVLEEREISIEWLERTLGEPELRLPDPDDATVERLTGKFPNSVGACSG